MSTNGNSLSAEWRILCCRKGTILSSSTTKLIVALWPVDIIDAVRGRLLTKVSLHKGASWRQLAQGSWVPGTSNLRWQQGRAPWWGRCQLGAPSVTVNGRPESKLSCTGEFLRYHSFLLYSKQMYFMYILNNQKRFTLLKYLMHNPSC